MAARVGLSVRHVRRIIVELETMGLVIARQIAHGRKTKNIYLLPHLTLVLELIHKPDMSPEQSREILSGFSSGSPKLMSALIPATARIHDDHDDEKHDMKDPLKKRASNKKPVKLDQRLLFLHEGVRCKRLRQVHCTPEYLTTWDE